MNIIEEKYEWAFAPALRPVTTHLILHHAAGSGFTAQDIHRMHQAKGWAGISYHFYVRKDGSVYRGRPILYQGGHTSGWNAKSLGICFEGNFEQEFMPAEQMAAGREIVAMIRGIWPSITIIGHRDVNATACPGRNFPMEIIKAAELPEKEDEDMARYNDIMDAPEWAQPTLFKLVSSGALKGNDNGLDLSEDMVRLLVIIDRMGVFA